MEKETRDIIITAGDANEVEVCSNNGQTLFYLPEVTGNKSNYGNNQYKVNQFFFDDEKGARFKLGVELR